MEAETWNVSDPQSSFYVSHAHQKETIILSFSLLIRICRCRCLPRTFALLCLYDYYVDFLLYLNYSADKGANVFNAGYILAILSLQLFDELVGNNLNFKVEILVGTVSFLTT